MKRRYTLRFSPRMVDKPVVGKLVKSYDLEINILNADVASGRGGKLIVELNGSEESLDESVNYLNEIGVGVSEMVKELTFLQEQCIDCGACTAVCSPRALSLDSEAKLVYDAALCVVCGLCVQACPLRLFSVSDERGV